MDYDKDSSFFAVYDGHGGNEVAEYLSRNFPNFLKNMEFYKEGDIEKTLIEGFLKMDASLNTPEVLAILEGIAMEGADTEEENIDTLYEEASMPVEKVIEKYIEGDVKNDSKTKGESSKSNDINNGAGCSKEKLRPDRTRRNVCNNSSSQTQKVADNTVESSEKTEELGDVVGTSDKLNSEKPEKADKLDSVNKVNEVNDVENSEKNEGNL